MLTDNIHNYCNNCFNLLVVNFQMLRLKLDHLILFQSLVKNIDVNVPKRWSIIKKKYKDTVDSTDIELQSKMLNVEIFTNYHSRDRFEIENDRMCKSLEKVCLEGCIPKVHNGINSYLFLPKVTSCHGNEVNFSKGNSRIMKNGQSCTIYTLNGVFEGSVYTATCSVCGSCYGPFYEESEKNNVTIRRVYKPEDKYFGITSSTVFSVKLLNHIRK